MNIISFLPTLAASSVEVSNTPPGLDRKGAVKYADWKLIGHEFMTASSINNWVGIQYKLYSLLLVYFP